MSEYRVHVKDDFMLGAYSIYVVDRQHRLLEPNGHWSAPLDPSVQWTAPASITVPKDVAHQVLGALARQLGAVEHPEQLRADYEAERARVDLFITNLLERRR